MLVGDIMKKWLNKQTVISFILGAILFSGVGVGAASYYQFSLSGYTLYVDNLKVNNPLYMYQGYNYIPLGAAAKALNLDVTITGKRIDLANKPTDIEEVAKNTESCVLIRVYSTTDPATAKLVGTASGVLIKDGIIVTNKHVLDAGKMYGIQYYDTPAGLDYKTTETYKIDTNLDIGFIKSPVSKKAVKIGDSDKLKVGEKLINISSPKGIINVVDECTFSGIKTLEDNGQIKNYIYLSDSTMDYGSSGGAVFNMRSELVAINQGGYNEMESNHSIPINDIKPMLDKLK